MYTNFAIYTTNLMHLYQKKKKAIMIVGNAKYRKHTQELLNDIKLLTIYQIIKLQSDISSGSSPIFYPVVSPNNGVGQIYPILLEIVLTPNLHPIIIHPSCGQPNFSALLYNCF